jgi:hypothetical protein
MAHYLVTAKPDQSRLNELKERLDSGEIAAMRPFGNALQHSLENAKMQDAATAIWEEEDYCIPPLAQERAAVLDDYFSELEVERVERGQGWGQLDGLPAMFDET